MKWGIKWLHDCKLKILLGQTCVVSKCWWLSFVSTNQYRMTTAMTRLFTLKCWQTVICPEICRRRLNNINIGGKRFKKKLLSGSIQNYSLITIKTILSWRNGITKWFIKLYFCPECSIQNIILVLDDTQIP